VVDSSKHAQHASFDRCSPSLLAFGERRDAEAFAMKHGGAVSRFNAVRLSK
jgi:hypothetical protein